MKNHLNYNLISMVAILNMMMIVNACESIKCEMPPVAITKSATFVTQSRATLNGVVGTSGQNTTVAFEFGMTTSYGQTIDGPEPWSFTASLVPTDMNYSLTGLSPATTYHYRFNAVGLCDITYGNDVSFTTLNIGESGIIYNPNLTYGSVDDTEGNTYKTIQVGTQTWMAENLRTTKFNDGKAIPLEANDITWFHLKTPAYCWYDNDSSAYEATVGALYNWYAVNTNKLCPTGWHVPTKDEWTTLITYLGSGELALGKLQETGTNHWISQNPRATNSSGFTVLPGGYRTSIYFGGIGYLSFFWSSIEQFTDYAWTQSIVFRYEKGHLGSNAEPKNDGNSVRCIRD